MHWLENLSRPFVRQSTYEGYRAAIRVHLIPNIGWHRLVVDCDQPKPGDTAGGWTTSNGQMIEQPTGLCTLAELEQRHGSLPPTYTVATAGAAPTTTSSTMRGWATPPASLDCCLTPAVTAAMSSRHPL